MAICKVALIYRCHGVEWFSEMAQARGPFSCSGSAMTGLNKDTDTHILQNFRTCLRNILVIVTPWWTHTNHIALPNLFFVWFDGQSLQLHNFDLTMGQPAATFLMAARFVH